MILATDFFTAYYILAVSFGALAFLLSAYAIWIRKDKEEFPGKLYGPIMIIGALFMVATLTAVIHGGNKEVEHRKQEKAEQAKEAAYQVAPDGSGGIVNTGKSN